MFPSPGRRFKFESNENIELINVQKGDKWGFLNKEGKVVIPFIYDEAHPFIEDLALVSVNGKYGYISKSGHLQIPAIYDIAEDFKEGLAAVKFEDNWGYINKNGKWAIDAQFELAVQFFNRDWETDRKSVV